MVMNLARNLSLTKAAKRLKLVQNEHWAIFNAIRIKDANAVKHFMRIHIENARMRVFERNSPTGNDSGAPGEQKESKH